MGTNETEIFVWFELTCIDKKLIGETGMIDIVNSSSEDGSHNFQIGEHRLSVCQSYWHEKDGQIGNQSIEFEPSLLDCEPEGQEKQNRDQSKDPKRHRVRQKASEKMWTIKSSSYRFE